MYTRIKDNMVEIQDIHHDEMPKVQQFLLDNYTDHSVTVDYDDPKVILYNVTLSLHDYCNITVDLIVD